MPAQGLPLVHSSVSAPACAPPPPPSRCRLCDRSPSVRKRAVALLAMLLQPAAGLSSQGMAALADVALPLAAKLLGLRPDSALRLGDEAATVGA